jgi:hypothetical protein
VTVTGTGTAGHTVTLYDWGRAIGSVLLTGATWTLIVNLGVGDHSLSAVQTSPVLPWGRLTSTPTTAPTFTVYAPPSAPPVTSAPANVISAATLTIGGRGIAGATVNVLEGTTIVGTALVGANGVWVATVTLAALSSPTPVAHRLAAQQQDPASGFWSAAGPSFVVTVYPQPAPPGFTTPVPPPRSSIPVTLSGTGVAGHVVTVYEGATVIGTAVVAANSTWTLSVRLAANMVHTLTATQTRVPGVTSAASGPVSVSVPR